MATVRQLMAPRPELPPSHDRERARQIVRHASSSAIRYLDHSPSPERRRGASTRLPSTRVLGVDDEILLDERDHAGPSRPPRVRHRSDPHLLSGGFDAHDSPVAPAPSPSRSWARSLRKLATTFGGGTGSTSVKRRHSVAPPGTTPHPSLPARARASRRMSNDASPSFDLPTGLGLGLGVGLVPGVETTPYAAITNGGKRAPVARVQRQDRAWEREQRMTEREQRDAEASAAGRSRDRKTSTHRERHQEREARHGEQSRRPSMADSLAQAREEAKALEREAKARERRYVTSTAPPKKKEKGRKGRREGESTARGREPERDTEDRAPKRSLSERGERAATPNSRLLFGHNWSTPNLLSRSRSRDELKRRGSAHDAEHVSRSSSRASRHEDVSRHRSKGKHRSSRRAYDSGYADDDVGVTSDHQSSDSQRREPLSDSETDAGTSAPTRSGSLRTFTFENANSDDENEAKPRGDVVDGSESQSAGGDAISILNALASAPGRGSDEREHAPLALRLSSMPSPVFAVFPSSPLPDIERLSGDDDELSLSAALGGLAPERSTVRHSVSSLTSMTQSNHPLTLDDANGSDDHLRPALGIGRHLHYPGAPELPRTTFPTSISNPDVMPDSPTSQASQIDLFTALESVHPSTSRDLSRPLNAAVAIWSTPGMPTSSPKAPTAVPSFFTRELERSHSLQASARGPVAGTAPPTATAARHGPPRPSTAAAAPSIGAAASGAIAQRRASNSRRRRRTATPSADSGVETGYESAVSRPQTGNRPPRVQSLYATPEGSPEMSRDEELPSDVEDLAQPNDDARSQDSNALDDDEEPDLTMEVVQVIQARRVHRQSDHRLSAPLMVRSESSGSSGYGVPWEPGTSLSQQASRRGSSVNVVVENVESEVLIGDARNGNDTVLCGFAANVGSPSTVDGDRSTLPTSPLPSGRSSISPVTTAEAPERLLERRCQIMRSETMAKLLTADAKLTAAIGSLLNAHESESGAAADVGAQPSQNVVSSSTEPASFFARRRVLSRPSRLGPPPEGDRTRRGSAPAHRPLPMPPDESSASVPSLEPGLVVPQTLQRRGRSTTPPGAGAMEDGARPPAFSLRPSSSAGRPSTSGGLSPNRDAPQTPARMRNSTAPAQPSQPAVIMPPPSSRQWWASALHAILHPSPSLPVHVAMGATLHFPHEDLSDGEDDLTEEGSGDGFDVALIRAMLENVHETQEELLVSLATIGRELEMEGLDTRVYTERVLFLAQTLSCGYSIDALEGVSFLPGEMENGGFASDLGAMNALRRLSRKICDAMEDVRERARAISTYQSRPLLGHSSSSPQLSSLQPTLSDSPTQMSAPMPLPLPQPTTTSRGFFGRLSRRSVAPSSSPSPTSDGRQRAGSRSPDFRPAGALASLAFAAHGDPGLSLPVPSATPPPLAPIRTNSQPLAPVRTNSQPLTPSPSSLLPSPQISIVPPIGADKDLTLQSLTAAFVDSLQAFDGTYAFFTKTIVLSNAAAQRARREKRQERRNQRMLEVVNAHGLQSVITKDDASPHMPSTNDLVCLALEHAAMKQYLTFEEIEEFDPSVFLILPRLAILLGLEQAPLPSPAELPAHAVADEDALRAAWEADAQLVNALLPRACRGLSIMTIRAARALTPKQRDDLELMLAGKAGVEEAISSAIEASGVADEVEQPRSPTSPLSPMSHSGVRGKLETMAVFKAIAGLSDRSSQRGKGAKTWNKLMCKILRAHIARQLAEGGGLDPNHVGSPEDIERIARGFLGA